MKQKQTQKPVQNQSQQINAVKKEIKAIDQKIAKLYVKMEKLIKDIVKLQKIGLNSRAKKRVSYIDWLENERRIKDSI
ncbi:MAG: hypothetical protein R3A12_17430 [Ignavibacteria bacterium]|nr:hypothetical protein [Ignavibacteriota bacterium]